MKKKIVFFLMLIMVPLLFIGGFSAWIISTKSNIVPQYDPEHELASYFEETGSLDYDTKEHLPSLKQEIINDSNFDSNSFANSLYYSYAEINENGSFVNGSNYITGSPIDAGIYSIKISLGKDDDDDISLFTTLTINPIDIISLEGSPTIESIYQGQMASFDDSSVSAVGLNSTSLTGSCKFTNSVGTTTAVYSGTASTSSHSVSMTFVPDSKNYKPYNFLVNYTMKPVAYISNKYYGSLESATSSAVSGNTIYVIPNLLNNDNTLHEIIVNKTITIKNGVSLILPYEGTTYDIGDKYTLETAYADANADTVKANRKTLVKLIDGADIIVDAGGTMYIGGINGARGIYSSYTEINLDTNSSITVNGTLECYGYIKENANSYKHSNQSSYQNIYDNSFDSGRFVEVKSGGYFKTSIAMYDMKAALTLQALDEAGVFPLNIFDFPNLQTYTVVESGATFASLTYLTGTTSVQNVVVHEEVLIVSSSASMFILNSGSAAFEYCPSNVNYTNTNGKTKIFVNGEISQGAVSINVDPGIALVDPINITTANKFIPFSYKLNIYINNNGVYTTSYKVKFLPGSLLKINSGGEMILDSEMAFYDTADSSEITSYGTRDNAKFINNGKVTLTANGKIGGLIETESSDNSATLDFTNVTSSNAFTVTSIEGNTAIEITKTSQGYFVDDTEEGKGLYQFVAGYTINSDVNGAKCWNGTKYEILKLNINMVDKGYTTNMFEYEITVADDTSGTNSTIITSGFESGAKVVDVAFGKYVKINIRRHAGATFSNGTIHDSNTWYQITEHTTLEIVPNEGVKLIVKTVSDSGNGDTSFTVYEYANGDTSNSYEIISWKGITEESTYIVKNWYFKISATNGLGETELDASNYTITPEGGSSSKFKVDTPYKADAAYTVYFPRKSISCLAEGTLISMADGSQKKVEDLRIGDMLLVFNHETGKFDCVPLLVNVHNSQDATYTDVINLTFDNGTILRIIYDHGLFDKTLNEYVYINDTNYMEFMYHDFVATSYVNGEYISITTKLIDFEITNEYINVYNPASVWHLNVIANGMLTLSSGMVNFFEYDENLKYNEESMKADLERYGEYTYEDFKDYVSIEVFNAFPFRYFKVAVAKGLITYEEILTLIEFYNSSV